MSWCRPLTRHSPDDIHVCGYRTTVPPPKGTAFLRQPFDGLIFVTGPRLEGHLPRFPAIQTHPSCRSRSAVDVSPAYAGAGLGRRSSIRLRIIRNSSLGTATSANWKVTWRPWRTTLAPILTNFSRIVVVDQSSASSGRTTFRLWLKADIPKAAHNVRLSPDSGHARRTF